MKVHEFTDVWIGDLMKPLLLERKPLVLEGHQFVTCQIYGPAILLFLGANTFSHTTFNNSGPVESMLWTPPKTTYVDGCIGIRDNSFFDCSLHAIGFSGVKEALDLFRQNVGAGS